MFGFNGKNKNKEKKAGGGELFDPKAAYRTEEQEKAVFYFSPENVPPADFKGCFEKIKIRFKGCFPKKEKEKKKGCFDKRKGCFAKGRYMPDAEYDALIQSIVQRLDPKKRGLEKLGLDESQVEKVISFANFTYIPDENDDTFFFKIGDDGRFRSSVFEVTYLFFTQDEILAYQLTLSSDWEKHDESTREYYYKDITALSTETLQKDVIEELKGEKTKVYKTVSNVFHIRVPNDSFTVALSNITSQEENDAIQGMKSLLREKKA
jgi:hypothetical protein